MWHDEKARNRPVILRVVVRRAAGASASRSWIE
jgi:hypothetical protein